MNPHYDRCHKALCKVHEASKHIRSVDGETVDQWQVRRLKEAAAMLADELFPQKKGK